MRNAERRRGRAAPAAALAVASLLAAAGAAQAAGRAVEGGDRTRILPPAGARVEPYANDGYRLRVEDGEVRVEVENAPLGSAAPFRRPAAPPRTSVERLARAVTTGADTEYQAVSRVLGWVARHLDYDLDRAQPQDAEAVLERRSGYCTGIARLTVALIEAAGISAREVAGYVVDDGGGPHDGATGYHRWIEAHLADRGWVFSDPMSSHHYVPATYVRLASETLVPSAGTEGLLIERRDGRATVDLYPAATAGVTARRNDARQRAAALRVSVEAQTHGTAVLEGSGSRFIHALRGGDATFVGLEPGRYTLRLLLPGRPVVERPVELAGRERTALFLPAGAIHGRPRPPADPSDIEEGTW